MNKEDRQTIHEFRDRIVDLRSEITNLGDSLDVNSQSILSLKDEVHELAPRYDEIIELLKKRGTKEIRSFDDLSPREMKKYIRSLGPRELETLRRYFDKDPVELHFAVAKDITGGPLHNRRVTDNRSGIMTFPEGRSNPKILSFFGLGKLKVEL